MRNERPTYQHWWFTIKGSGWVRDMVSVCVMAMVGVSVRIRLFSIKALYGQAKFRVKTRIMVWGLFGIRGANWVWVRVTVSVDTHNPNL